MRTINAVGDRLLGLFVPTLKASADPCGREYYVNCHCSYNMAAGYHVLYRRHCCSNGGCSSCFNSGIRCSN